MGKGNGRCACCTTENIGLDLPSCWMGANPAKGYAHRAVKTIAFRKPTGLEIRNRVGGFLKKYNLIVYGPNNGDLNIDVVFLLNGYACLCRADTSSTTGNARDITISLVSRDMPRELMQQLAEAEIPVWELGQGIYGFQYMFDFQVAVLDELPMQEKAWLEGLVAQ